MGGDDAHFFPLERTPEEAELGFAVEGLPTGQRALVAHLANGLSVVKVVQGGTVAYAVCLDYESIYVPSRSLDELRERFGISRAS